MAINIILFKFILHLFQEDSIYLLSIHFNSSFLSSVLFLSSAREVAVRISVVYLPLPTHVCPSFKDSAERSLSSQYPVQKILPILPCLSVCLPASHFHFYSFLSSIVLKAVS